MRAGAWSRSKHGRSCTIVSQVCLCLLCTNSTLMYVRVDHDYLRFPVYALTGCALILGLIESIVLNFKMEHVPTLQSVASGGVKRSQKMRRERCECRKFRRKANKLVGPVEEDVRALLGVSVVRPTGSGLTYPPFNGQSYAGDLEGML